MVEGCSSRVGPARPKGLVIFMAETIPSGVTLRRGRRFFTLDALRGIGALFVVLGHFGTIVGGFVPPFYYLPVDLFFLLSGFVLSYSYDQQFERGLTFSSFIKMRVTRLYPIYFLGLAVGTAVVLFINPLTITTKEIGISFITGAVGLPTPIIRSIPRLFPLNGPFWSLLFEFWVANILYAALWRQLRGWVLGAVILGSAACLIEIEHAYYTIDFGWAWSKWLLGFPRVLFSFFAGVALFRFVVMYPPRVRVPSWMCLGLAAGSMLVPFQGRLGHAYELASVLVLFPVIIYLGTEAIEKDPRIGKALGDTSYAAYATHYPLVAVAKAAVVSLAPWVLLRADLTLLVQACFILLICVLAFGVDLLDVQVRRRINRVLISRLTRSGAKTRSV